MTESHNGSRLVFYINSYSLNDQIDLKNQALVKFSLPRHSTSLALGVTGPLPLTEGVRIRMKAEWVDKELLFERLTQTSVWAFSCPLR